MAATIYDIARLTGYNAGTVSRALNNDPRVREKTREKIREVGNLLGYVPNLAAKSLITGKTRIIAVVTCSSCSAPMTALMMSLNEILIKHDYLLMSMIYNNKEQFKRCMERLRSGFCDGAILQSPVSGLVDSAEIENLLKLKYPVVCFDQWIPEVNLPVITNDAEKSIRCLIEELMKTGMEAAYLVPHGANTVSQWREDCAKRILEEKEIPYITNKEEISDFIKVHDVKNFMVYADSTKQFKQLETYFPKKEDLTITAGLFDPWNMLIPKYISRLVLCIQDFDLACEAAVHQLFQMIDGKEVPAETTLIPPKEIITPITHD